MGKCWKYLHDLLQIITNTKTLRGMHMYQILTINLTGNTNYGQKTEYYRNPYQAQKEHMAGMKH